MRCAVATVAAFLLFLSPSYALEITDAEIAAGQKDFSSLPVGERIALWAERFVGTPYDPDPLGAYVTRRAIVADDNVDCMYLTFRSAELALTNSPAEALERALTLRFRTQGIIEDGSVKNYDERYEYAEDMLRSGKWGEDITLKLPGVAEMEGSRGVEEVSYIPREAVPGVMGLLRSGDIVFFVKEPSRRVVGEIVGHIGIIKEEGGPLFLIHASGRKNKGGSVVKAPFEDYVSGMPFAGIMVGRFY